MSGKTSTHRARAIPVTHLLSAWLLITGFLLQPVLAYLVTPILTHDVNGQQVVICTLQGEKLVNIDLPSIDDQREIEHCAALKLYQMASSASLPLPPTLPSRILHLVSILDARVVAGQPPSPFFAYTTRAPPVA